METAETPAGTASPSPSGAPADERAGARLSTLNADGSRRWLYPRVSPGRFLVARRVTAWILIVVFAALPYIPIDGKAAVLLDIVHREFTFFGKTFLPTDTLLLALLLVGGVVAIFFLTAVFGRVWCGYGCPQTVYMEFVYRPIERLFDGPPRSKGRPGKKRSPPRTVAKYVVFLLFSMFIAHVFLAYFVGVEALERWVLGSPSEHPTAFAVMAVTTALMMADFCYFREQTCIVACPYGRLQTVLFDRDTLIISYDPRRGEPRGKPRRRGAENARPARGDCVDCGLCVDTCPTGIDIRDGLRMECIGCAQCIDACDAVMERIGKPRGLIRYSSPARIENERARPLRPRVVVYPVILIAVATLFTVVLARQQSADVTLLRGLGAPFTRLGSGEVSNLVRVKVTNRGRSEARYRVELASGQAGRLIADINPIPVPPGASRTQAMVIVVPETVFTGGRYDIILRISDGAEFSRTLQYRLFGPAAGAPSGTSRSGTSR